MGLASGYSYVVRNSQWCQEIVGEWKVVAGFGCSWYVGVGGSETGPWLVAQWLALHSRPVFRDGFLLAYTMWC